MRDPDQQEPRDTTGEQTGEQASADGAGKPTAGGESAGKAADKAAKALRARRGRRRKGDLGFERIAEVHYCRSDAEANEYLSLGPEWDLQDIVPMRVETEDGGERDEIHFVVARWENDRDRARLRARDRRTGRSSRM